MPRRVLAVAAAAGLVLTVLTGCHSDPRVAAYVDGVTITEAQVDSVLSEATAAVDKDNEAIKNDPSATPEQAPTRVDVVAALTAKEIADRTLTQLGIAATPANPPQVQRAAELLKTRYAAAVLSVQAGFTALVNAADKNVQASDADLRDIYDREVGAGFAPAGHFADVKPQLQQAQGLAQEIAVRNQLAKQAAQEHVTVNPRYAPLEYPLLTATNQSTGESFVALAVPLVKGPAGNPVIDAPRTAAPEALPAG
jgi:hypothetical protein